MDPLASEDTTNAPGAVSDELIHAENAAIEQQQADQSNGTTRSKSRFTRLLSPLTTLSQTKTLR